MFILFLFLSIANAKSNIHYPCKATYDDLNIPHQETKSLEEFYYCFGHHHGRDRAWEMDFFRRVGQGRNAEVLGFDHLKSDLMMRLLDLPGVAKKLWRGFSPEKKKWLELYAAGANEGFKTGKNAKEFKDMDYAPELWKPEDSILVLLLQSFDQTRKTFQRDYEEEQTKEKWKEKTDFLFNEDGAPWESTILKAGEYPKRDDIRKTSKTKSHLFKLWGEFPQFFGRESGSNNWVISREKSKTGHAILANDPHLDLKTPMFWYWIHLKSPEINVIGGSVPGVPVIASGTNGKVSWGLTNSYMNSADLVFVNDLTEEELDSFYPTVYIKFWKFKIPFFFKKFERLKSGHRVLPLESKNDDKIVLKWSGFSLKSEEIYPMFDLYKVNDVQEMDSLLEKIGIPSWNFVFADTKGKIGYQLVGKVYRQDQKTPFGIVTKKLSELDHDEFLAPSEKPRLLNPKRHYIASANNRHWPWDSKFYGGRGYSYSYRSLQIDKLLRGKHDPEDFKKFQCDLVVKDAEFFVPILLKNIAIPEFQNWDMLAHDESTVLPLYRRLIDLLLEKWEVNEYALYRLLENLSVVQKENLGLIYKEAQSEVKGRNWGEIHRVSFPHMSKNEEWNFAQEIAGPGDTHSINPGTSRWNKDRKIYEQHSGASMRMIIEMSNPVKIDLILPGLNRAYTEKPSVSPWQEWKDCRYRRLNY